MHASEVRRAESGLQEPRDLPTAALWDDVSGEHQVDPFGAAGCRSDLTSRRMIRRRGWAAVSARPVPEVALPRAL